MLRTALKRHHSAGTATIVDTEYVQSTKGAKQHSKQITREKLGRPLALAADRRSGIFRSQEYGIVAYDADTASKEVLEMDDPRLEGSSRLSASMSTRCSATASSSSVI